MMPDIDGWTVLAAIKGDPGLADIPVILVTIVDEKNRGYALGATDYMVKPVDRERLADVLRNICGAVGRAGAAGRRRRRRCGAGCGLHSSRTAGGVSGGGERPGGAGRGSRESAPDIIVLDLMMPEMDGFEFLVEMRSRAEWRDIPVLSRHREGPHGREERALVLNGDVARVLLKGALRDWARCYGDPGVFCPGRLNVVAARR